MREQENPDVIGRFGQELTRFEDENNMKVALVVEKEAKVEVNTEEDYQTTGVVIFGSKPILEMKQNTNKGKSKVQEVEENYKKKEALNKEQEAEIQQMSVELKKQSDAELASMKIKEKKMLLLN